MNVFSRGLDYYVLGGDCEAELRGPAGELVKKFDFPGGSYPVNHVFDDSVSNPKAYLWKGRGDVFVQEYDCKTGATRSASLPKNTEHLAVSGQHLHVMRYDSMLEHYSVGNLGRTSEIRVFNAPESNILAVRENELLVGNQQLHQVARVENGQIKERISTSPKAVIWGADNTWSVCKDKLQYCFLIGSDAYLYDWASKSSRLVKLGVSRRDLDDVFDVDSQGVMSLRMKDKLRLIGPYGSRDIKCDATNENFNFGTDESYGRYSLRYVNGAESVLMPLNDLVDLPAPKAPVEFLDL